MATRTDPYRNYDFLVEISGVISAGFAECNVTGSATDVIEYREGGENRTPRKLAGLTKHSNVTLKRGMTDSMDLYNWFSNIMGGIIDRRNVAVTILDTQGNPKIRWNYTNAWPTKLTGPDLNSKGTDVAIETLEFVHEGVERVS